MKSIQIIPLDTYRLHCTLITCMSQLRDTNIELRDMAREQQRELAAMGRQLTVLMDSHHASVSPTDTVSGSCDDDGFAAVTAVTRSTADTTARSSAAASARPAPTSRSSAAATSARPAPTSRSSAAASARPAPTLRSSAAATSARPAPTSRSSAAASARPAPTLRSSAAATSARPAPTSTSSAAANGRSIIRAGVTFANAVAKPAVPLAVVIGTSLVRGVGSRLVERGVDATVYTYPGLELPHIQKSVINIFTPEYQPSHVIIPCGGNDAATCPPHQVVREYERLVRTLEDVCPESTITLGLIPPRGTDPIIIGNIAKINTYISNRGKHGDRVVFCNACPSDRQHFKRDLIHFNETGTNIFTDRLATHILNLQACPHDY